VQRLALRATAGRNARLRFERAPAPRRANQRTQAFIHAALTLRAEGLAESIVCSQRVQATRLAPAAVPVVATRSPCLRTRRGAQHGHLKRSAVAVQRQPPARKAAMATSHYLYAATSQKPTGVTHAITGSFTGARDVNLILGKTSRLEIHTVTPTGLQPVADVGIYGRIANMQLMRLPVRRVKRSATAGITAGRRRGRGCIRTCALQI
jgi:hypothetical protein